MLGRNEEQQVEIRDGVVVICPSCKGNHVGDCVKWLRGEVERLRDQLAWFEIKVAETVQ